MWERVRLSGSGKHKAFTLAPLLVHTNSTSSISSNAQESRVTVQDSCRKPIQRNEGYNEKRLNSAEPGNTNWSCSIFQRRVAQRPCLKKSQQKNAELQVISCRCWGQGWELNLSQAERQERRRANRAGEGREKTEQKQKHLWPHWAGRAGTGTMTTCSFSWLLS